MGNQKVFSEQINGVDIQQINSMIDYTIPNYEQRLEVVNNIYDLGFFDEYIEKYYDPCINLQDCLAEEINVFNTIERLSSYLLNSLDKKDEMRYNKVEYRFHSDPNYFRKKLNKDLNLESVGDGSGEVIDFLLDKGKNNKVGKTQKIFKKDLKNSKNYGILKEYQDYLDYLKEQIKIGSDNRYKISSLIHGVKDDMIYSKDTLHGVFGYNMDCSNETSDFDMGVVDLTDINHLIGQTITNEDGSKSQTKGVLFLFRNYNHDDYDFMIMQKDELVEEVELTKLERDVADLISDGHGVEDISNLLVKDKSQVSRIVKNIGKKVSELAKKKYAWYEIKQLLK